MVRKKPYTSSGNYYDRSSHWFQICSVLEARVDLVANL